MTFAPLTAGGLGIAALMFCTNLSAQAPKLPPTSRTVYKCTVKDKVIYSDEPCIGAQRIDVEPTRGMSKSSGREMVGSDVQREKQHEAFVSAVQPLTGMNKQQFDTEQRRGNLSANLKTECKRLDKDIAAGEIQERTEPKTSTSAIQGTLLVMRKRHKEISC